MSERTKAKIIQFPKAAKRSDTEERDVLADIKAALEKPAEADASHPRQASPEHNSMPAQPVTVNGDGNVQFARRDIHNHTYYVEKPPKPVVVVQTGVGAIDAKQKRRLLELRDDVVEASKAGAKPKTPGGVMLALNRYMKVNKYDEILADDFDKAVKWMIRQRAIKTSLRSASKKLPDWRNRRIGAIHARCKEKGFETWRLDHMKKKFGTESMIDLSDTDLETLYRAVMAKK